MDAPQPFRPEHYLEPNRRTTSPGQILCVAVRCNAEPHPSLAGHTVQTLDCWAATTVRLDAGKISRCGSHSGTDSDSFWGLCLKLATRRRPLYVYAYQISLAVTLLKLWELIDAGTLRLSDDDWPIRQLARHNGRDGRPWRGTLVTEDPPTVIVVRHGAKTIKLVDVRNYWPATLEELDADMGTATAPSPASPFQGMTAVDQCTEDACIVEAAMLGLVMYWRKENLGSWRNTAAGLSWNHYRHSYLKEGQILIHGNRDACQLERESYYGGETRVFYAEPVLPAADWSDAVCLPGNGPKTAEIGPVYHLDATSLYAYCMAAERYPARLAAYYESCRLDVLERLPCEYGAVAEVELDTEIDTYPVRIDKTLVWGRGRFHTVLAWPELHQAVIRGHVKAVGRTAIYELDGLFSQWAWEVWQRRKAAWEAGQVAEYRLWKLILASLHGKFAQHADRWVNEGESVPPVPWGEWHWSKEAERMPQLYRSVAWHTQRYQEHGEHVHSFPAIAAFTTSHARLVMQRLRALAGPRNVYYQDTDSLHVSPDGLAALTAYGVIDPMDLGKLKIVAQARTAHYYGPKDYELDGQHCIAGVSPAARQIDPRTYQLTVYPRLRSILAGRPDGTIVSKRAVVSLQGCHAQGVVGEDGWITPVTFE